MKPIEENFFSKNNLVRLNEEVIRERFGGICAPADKQYISALGGQELTIQEIEIIVFRSEGDCVECTAENCYGCIYKANSKKKCVQMIRTKDVWLASMYFIEVISVPESVREFFEFIEASQPA